tara:strand:- start:128 stop:1069 length:942 start_codon:yes stop_codon:yes gene_type:complete
LEKQIDTTHAFFFKQQINFIDKCEKQGKSPNTLKNYKTDLNCFNNFLNDNGWVPCRKSLTNSLIRHYAHFLDKKYSSDNSRRRRLQTLRNFFDFLLSEGEVPNNPVRSIPTSPKFLDVPRPTSFKNLKIFWNHLLQEIDESKNLQKLISFRNLIITLLIFKGGLKVSDLSCLKRCHIFLGKNPRVMLTPPKRDPFSIPLPNEFDNFLVKYLDLLKIEMANQNIEFEELLFNANPYKILSGGLSSRGLEIIFKEYSENLKIELTPRSLRQACIFNWLKDKNEENIKEWMGVAPSYSLKHYKEHLPKHIYSDLFH